jgi:hypothetical protein
LLDEVQILRAVVIAALRRVAVCRIVRAKVWRVLSFARASL